MHMMFANTEGNEIKVRTVMRDIVSAADPEEVLTITKLEFKMGNVEMAINFDTIEEMKSFCDEHNFPYEHVELDS